MSTTTVGGHPLARYEVTVMDGATGDTCSRSRYWTRDSVEELRLFGAAATVYLGKSRPVLVRDRWRLTPRRCLVASVVMIVAALALIASPLVEGWVAVVVGFTTGLLSGFVRRAGWPDPTERNPS